MKPDPSSSADAPPSWERVFQNELPALCRATEDAVAFLRGHGLGEQAIYACNLIIEEIGTNILKYAYGDRHTHEIRLHLRVEPRRVKIVFEDDGREFNPQHAPAPDLNAPLEERKIGGLGITLVRQFASAIQYERIGAINRLSVLVPCD